MSARLDNVLMVTFADGVDDEPPPPQAATPKMSKQAMELAAKFATNFLTVSSWIWLHAYTGAASLAVAQATTAPTRTSR
jgi:hypothetical protein